MITPVVPEHAWRVRLDRLPPWQPPWKQTLVVAPHPDDETLGAGGLIAALRDRDIDVMVVAVTDGENSYADVPGLAALREGEQTAALGHLGVSPDRIHRLRLPDGKVAAHEARVIECLIPLVSLGTHIVAPWKGDFHPDHEACGRAAVAVAQAKGASLTSYFFWTWHHGEPGLFDRLHLAQFPLGEKELRRKQDALRCHRSQLEHSGGDPVLPPDLLAPIHRPYEVFLPS